MADGPSLGDVKKLLDDPGVTDTTKRDLLSAYVVGHPDDSGELRSHADRLGMPTIGLGGFGRPGWDTDPLAPVALKQAMDQAQRQRNRHAADSGKQTLGEGGSGAGNSNPILDLGAPGLRFFEYFAPLYRRCVPGTDISRDKACQLYDEQRDLDLGALRADAARIVEAGDKLASEIVDERNAWNTVDQIWTGQGAEAANGYVNGYLGQAGVAQSQVQQFGKVMGPAADALERAVRDKATFVVNLYADTIGGKTPEQIDEIISYAQSGHNAFSGVPEAVRILGMFGASISPSLKDGLLVAAGNIGPGASLLGAGSYVDDLLDKAQQVTENFVDRVFKPEVEGKWRGFVDTCKATDTSVREIYQRIVDYANTINTKPFTTSTGALPPIPERPPQPETNDRSYQPGDGQSHPAAVHSPQAVPDLQQAASSGAAPGGEQPAADAGTGMGAAPAMATDGPASPTAPVMAMSAAEPDAAASSHATSDRAADASQPSGVADGSGEVRAASATGWSTSGDPDAAPALAHADAAPGLGGDPTGADPAGTEGAGTEGAGTEGAVAESAALGPMGTLRGDLGGAPVAAPAADQWLVDGGGDESAWDSLESVLSSPGHGGKAGDPAAVLFGGESPR